jgi:hypothetical protein
MASPSRLLPPGLVLRGTVEQAVWTVLRFSTPTARHAGALSGLFGIYDRSGYPPVTHREAAAAMGTSQKTLRHWLQEAREAAQSLPVPASITAAVGVAGERLPRLAPDLAAAWRTAGCTRHALHPAAVAAAARLFGVTPSWKVDTVGWQVPIAVPAGRTVELREARRRLHRYLRDQQPTNWATVAKRTGLIDVSTLRVLAEAEGISTGPNGPVDLTPRGPDLPLLRQLEAAGRPMTTDELLAGVRRWAHGNHAGPAPTTRQLKRVLAGSPLYDSDRKGWFAATPHMVELARRDRIVLTAVAAADGQARVHVVIQALLQAGYRSRAGAQQAVLTCPVVRSVPGRRGWLVSLDAST